MENNYLTFSSHVPWKRFNICLVSATSEHCKHGNMKKRGLQLITIIPQGFVYFSVSQCSSERAETAGAALLFMSHFSHVSTTKKSIKKGKSISGAAKSLTERWREVCWQAQNLFNLLQMRTLYKWQRKVALASFIFIYLFSFLSTPPPPPPTALPHSMCSGPLGCLSTSRSEFDICWNTQWSVQA